MNYIGKKNLQAAIAALVMVVAMPWILVLVVPSHPANAVEPVLQGPNFNSPDLRKAFFDASRIYGKAGCGDMNLAELTARNAIRSGVPANLLAAIVAVESSCDPLAISNKGAVGLTQVNVKVQAIKFAQFRAINLFDPEQSMRVGTDILRDNIAQYGGVKQGVTHYNGTGPDADAYALKVLALAGK